MRRFALAAGLLFAVACGKAATGSTTDPCKGVTMPVALLGPHAAVLGMIFYTGRMFPAAYKDTIFVARKGSWNRTKLFGYDVVNVKIEPDGKNPKVTPFGLIGFGWAVTKEPQGVHAMMSKGTYGHGGAFGTQGWIDPSSDLIKILLIQRADGGTESMRNVFLNMAEASAAGFTTW